MFRTDVAATLRDTNEEDGFLFPDYGGYCFAHVPATALSALGVDVGSVFPGGRGRTLPDDVFEGVDTDVDNVVVALVDGYGFQQYRRDRDDYRMLDRLADRGTVSPLTSIYPSETAAAITTTHTGYLPAQHGLLGWDQYVEEVDSVLRTLPFETKDGNPADEARVAASAPRHAEADDADRPLGANPRMLFEGDSFYGRLARTGVDPVGVVPDGLSGTAYSELAMAGLDAREYRNVADAGVQVREILRGEGRTYCYCYFPQVDAAAHHAGTESAEYAAQLELVTEAIRREVVEKLDPETAERTLLVLTADHGEVDTTPEENVDLRAGRFDPLWDALRRDEAGKPIPPVGGSRNVQLHLQEGTVDRIRDLLESELDARTFTREQVLARDLFGPGERGDLFERRLGDLVVVPRDRSVWYEDATLAYIGMHGGLHPDEMLVPFGASTVSTVQG